MRECCNVFAALADSAVTSEECIRYGLRLYLAMPLGVFPEDARTYLVVCSGFARVFRTTDMVFSALNDILKSVHGRAFKCQLVGHFFEEV